MSNDDLGKNNAPIAVALFIAFLILGSVWVFSRGTLATYPSLFVVTFIPVSILCAYMSIKYGARWLGVNWGICLVLSFYWIVIALWNIYFIGIFTLGCIFVSILLRHRVMEAENARLRLLAEEEKRKQEEQRRIREEQKIRREEFEREQRAKGLVKYKRKWGTPDQVREWKEIDLGMRNNFEDLSPEEFERFIGKLFTKMGYNIEDLQHTKDYGADLLAKRGKDRIVIQVKKWSGLVGNKEVQQALGSMHFYEANRAILITTSYFTTYAQEQAKPSPIELWDKDVLYDMIKRYMLSD